MNYPAASSGVSLKAMKRPKGLGIKPFATQINFPLVDSPENSEKTLCAFYWDSAVARWQVIMRESIGNNLMTVQTQHFSYWQ